MSNLKATWSQLQAEFAAALPDERLDLLTEMVQLNEQAFGASNLSDLLLNRCKAAESAFFSSGAPGSDPETQKAAKLQVLRQFEFLASDPALTELLADACELQDFSPEEIILQAGEYPEGLTFVPGEVELELPSGGEVRRAKALLGGLSLLGSGHKPLLTGRAKAQIQAVLLPVDQLLPLFRLHPHLRMLLLAEVLWEEENELRDALAAKDSTQEQLRLTRRILDNLGQAVFTIDPQGEIGENYSIKAGEYLGYRELTGRPFADLILRHDEKALRNYYRALSMLYAGNQHDPEVIISLLPAEIHMGEDHYRLGYSFVEDNQGFIISVIVRMEDIAEEMALKAQEEMAEAERAAEQRMQELIKENIGSFLSLMDLIQDNQRALNDFQSSYLGQQIQPDAGSITALMNSLHTVKGLCGQFEMTRLKQAVHEMEDAMQAIAKQGVAVGGEVFKEKQKNLKKQIKLASNLLESIGDNIVKILQGINFTPEEFKNLSQLAAAGGSRELQDYLVWKTNVPAALVVEGWEKDLESLAQRLGKQLEFRFEADPNLRLPKELARTLNFELRHIYRNCADHGLERAEVRLQAGKPEVGLVKARLSQTTQELCIELSDDGAGINEAKVVELARKKEQLEQVEVERLAKAGQAWRILFLPGFSSAETVSDISGRGVGLDAVEKAVNKLAGSVEVESSQGKGTLFLFRFPVGST